MKKLQGGWIVFLHLNNPLQIMKLNNKPIIPIFFAADDAYSPYLGVSIASLKANASKAYFYQIYILNTGISDFYRQSLNTLNDVNLQITYVDVSNKLEVIAERLHTRDYYSKTTYYRLFIADMFPEYDKALYLDADITVLGDISTFFNIEIGENWVGAIPDDVVNGFDEFIVYSEKVLGIPAPKYFNAGILIMNLKKFREVNFLDKFADLLTKVKFSVAQDQDYLNALCVGHVHYISKKWNRMPIPDPNFDVNELCLIHYNLTAKPWHYNDILYGEHFWKYAKMTPFYDDLIEVLESYSEEEIARDKACEANLKQLALKEANMEKTYYTMYVKGKK